jgi:predicted Zn finger-like uncharacterized protein
MIVTCPGCGSKYRVRDEAVPQGGAELKCPSCGAVFVAHPPKHSDQEIAGALEKITKAKEQAEQRVAELDKRQGELERRAADGDRRALEAEARVQQLEAQMIVLKSELVNTQNDARSQRAPLEAEIKRLHEETQRLIARANAAADAEMRVMQLTEELNRLRAAPQGEIQRLKDELAGAEKTTGRLYTELDDKKRALERLEQELRNLREAERDKTNPAAAPAPISAISPSGPVMSPALASLVAAVAPMLWGLEQAIKYLEPFANNEPALAGHLRQLLLLQGVLQRLAKEAAQN